MNIEESIYAEILRAPCKWPSMCKVKLHPENVSHLGKAVSALYKGHECSFIYQDNDSILMQSHRKNMTLVKHKAIRSFVNPRGHYRSKTSVEYALECTKIQALKRLLYNSAKSYIARMNSFTTLSEKIAHSTVYLHLSDC